LEADCSALFALVLLDHRPPRVITDACLRLVYYYRYRAVQEVAAVAAYLAFAQLPWNAYFIAGIVSLIVYYLVDELDYVI